MIIDLQKALDHHRAGRLREAEEIYRRLLVTHPAHDDARRLLAVLKHQTGRSQEALAELDALLAARPVFPEAQANRAVVLAALGRADEAEAGFRQVLLLSPGFPDAFGPLVRLLLAQERLGEATELLNQSPAGWVIERAALALKLGRPDQAEKFLSQGLGQMPGNPDLLGALVPVLTIMGRHKEAVEAGRASLALNPRQPGLHHNLALTLLDAGNLPDGWRHFAHRWEAPGFPSHPRQLSVGRWDGKSDPAGQRLLVWREQGVGDEITFVSALPDLIERAGQVVVECSAKLAPLFARSFPKALVRPEDRRQDPTPPGITLHLPMGDLFPAFRPSLAAFPERSSYLVADAGMAKAWKRRLASLGPAPKIGIAWKSTLVTPARSHNFLPSLAQMEALLAVPGVQFVNLQPRADKAELEAARQRTGAVIHDFEDLDLFDDLDGTAALMTALDKVAAIGTATAILSAALGVPTGMFLLKHAQWDPMGTERIPWLPAATLFRRFWNEGWEQAAGAAASWIGGATRTEAGRQPAPTPTIEISGAEDLLDQATAAHLDGKKAEAEALYRSVLARDPQCVEALVNLAALLDEQGRLEDARQLLAKACRLRPREPAVLDNLGRLLIRMDRLDEAAPMLEAALALEPGNATLMNDLGNVLRLLSRPDDSARWLQKAVRAAPGLSQARFNLAKSLRELGRCQEALDQLLAIKAPDRSTLWEIGATYLQMGRLKEGWTGIEYRPGGLGGRPVPDVAAKTVLVTSEQGVGDILFYAQALPDLMAAAGQTIVQAPLKLHALLERSFPGIRLIEDGALLPSHDVALPFGSLFHVFRPTLESFSGAKPFLAADPGKTAAWKKRLDALGSGFKLGVAWRSTLVTRERARRFPGGPEKMAPLLNLPGVVPVNLQAKAAAEEARGLVTFADCDLFDDLDETAALISALDAVSVNDSAIGILSAALGTRTALLMRAHTGWDRLGTQGLPWLPAAKLFDCAWNEPWERAAERAADWIRALQARSNV